MAKTLRSRIAAVAVVALGAGVISAVPASAAPAATKPFYVTAAEYSSDADAGTFDGTNAATSVSVTQVAGDANYVEFEAGADTTGATNVYVDVTGSTITRFTNSTNVTGTLNTAATRLTYPGNDINDEASATFRVATTTAGTVTVKVIKSVVASGAATNTTLQTFTIKVNATATKNVPVASKTEITAYDKDDNEIEDAISMPATVASGSNWDNWTQFVLTTYDANDVTTNKTLTASLSGVGVLEGRDTSAGGWSIGKVVTAKLGEGWADGATTVGFAIYSDGTPGTATVTFKYGTTVLGTKTVTFYGDVASLSATQLKYSLSDAAGSTAYVKITAKDSAGNSVPVAAADGAVVETVSALDVTAVTDADNGTATNIAVDPAAGKYGTKTITWKHTATALTVTTTVVISGVIDSVAVTTDKAAYVVGEPIKVSVTAKDAKGNIAVDGATAADSVTVKTSTFQNATLPTTLTFKNGVATFTISAPATTGAFTVTATFNDGDDFSDNVDDVSKTVTAAVTNPDLDKAVAESTKAAAAVAALSTTITSIQTAISTLVASTTATLTVMAGQIAKIMKKLGIK